MCGYVVVRDVCAVGMRDKKGRKEENKTELNCENEKLGKTAGNSTRTIVRMPAARLAGVVRVRHKQNKDLNRNYYDTVCGYLDIIFIHTRVFGAL